MKRLSILMFTCNDVAEALALLEEMYDVADQIVVVDSSDRANKQKLKNFARNKGPGKIEIYDVIALGYADPLRTYALSKCRNDWVVYLDPDERLSEEMKNDMLIIASRASAAAFAIKRYEKRGTQSKSFFTWQIRLYDKRKVTYKGIIHEQPLVSGSVEKLGPKYYMTHLKNPIRRDYNRMDLFERFSYRTFNARIGDYLSKMKMPKDRSREDAGAGKLLSGFLSAYEYLGRKKPEQEISNLDYYLLFTLRDVVYCIKDRNLLGAIKIPFIRIKYVREIRKMKMSNESKMIFDISQKIEKIGIIKYLGLDSEKRVEALTAKYRGKEQGTSLLIKLLKEKYSAEKGGKSKRL